MAALPPLTQLGGNQKSLFEGYWTMLDPQNTGKVDAGTAATFMKKSQLREPVLHKIWNMSDPGGKGYLDKQGLFMALRLIATCQAGKEPQVANMALSDPPPKFVGVEVPASATANKWTIEEAERTKFEKVFQGLQPSKGLLGGDKARPFMLQSKLPRDTLGKIWGLSDIDKDGSLDLDEFCVAMKLISLAQSGEVLSASLPASLIPPSKSIGTSTMSSSGGVAAPPTSTSAGGILTAAMLPIPTSLTPTPADSSPSHGSPVPPKKLNATPLATPPDVEWVVNAELKSKYDGYFQGIDKDHDGYVSGEEARSLFMASNLQQPVLAHIWNLCDIEKNGKLNAEQFALAMYLIAEKVRKKDPPKELTPAMIPPSLRSKVPPPQASSSSSLPSSSSSSISTVASSSGVFSTSTTMATTSASLGGNPTSTVGGEGAGFGFGSDFSAIQELDSISNEVEAIRKEKLELAEDIKAKQELIEQRKAEMEGFQENVDVATKQRVSLEKEKEEARNMLEQLNNEKARFEGQIAELKQKCDDEKDEIERLKVQLSEQETSNKTQAEELAKLQDQLQQLRKEEQEFRQKVNSQTNPLVPSPCTGDHTSSPSQYKRPIFSPPPPSPTNLVPPRLTEITGSQIPPHKWSLVRQNWKSCRRLATTSTLKSLRFSRE